MNKRSQLLTYCYLACTVAVIGLATQAGARLDMMGLVLVGVISPLLLAVGFSYFEEGWLGVRSFFAHPSGFNFNPVAVICAALLPCALMLLCIYIDRGQISPPDFGIMLSKLPILLILMTGEEYGWRRYAFARLSTHMAFLPSAIIVGLVWWLWHYPGYLIGMGTPEKMSFFLFGAMVIPASILIALLYRWTQNIYLVILAHVSSNLAFSGLPFLPEHTGDSSAFIYYTTMLWLLVVPLCLNKKYWAD
jgi:membrane protease YdiL (CAAX protease family)